MTGEEMFLSLVVGTMVLFATVLGGVALFTRGASSSADNDRQVR
jgi:hypothetical protein